MMTIGIEGQRLYRKKKHGMDMVALELIKNLQLIDQTNRYVIFVKPNEDSSCIPSAPNFKIVELNSSFGYPGWEQSTLPKAALEHKCDILHCTSNTAPIKSKVPIMITLHDIIYMESVSVFKKAGTWYQKLGNMYRRLVVPSVVKKSKRIITVSEYERKRIQDFFHLTDQQLVAVYNGVGAHFTKVTDTATLSMIKQQYGLPNHFFFFLGNTDPKKNTKGVLKAFADFNKTASGKYMLVMPDYDENELHKLLNDINAPEIRALIHLTGYIKNTDLPAIISQCEVFLYPSLRESFGIPILEGMACGVPVVTSNTSSMPEIAGNSGAAVLVDPYKPEEITAAILSILGNKELAASLVEKGTERAKEFSWYNMALKVHQLYRDIYDEIKA